MGRLLLEKGEVVASLSALREKLKDIEQRLSRASYTVSNVYGPLAPSPTREEAVAAVRDIPSASEVDSTLLEIERSESRLREIKQSLNL